MGTNILRKKENNLSANPLLILIAIGIAIPLGIFIRNTTSFPSNNIVYKIFHTIDLMFSTTGKIYLDLLEMVIYPIVISAIVTSITGLIKSEYLGIFIRRFIFINIVFFLAFSAMGVISGMIFHIGKGISEVNLQKIGEIIQKNKELEVVLGAPLAKSETKNFLTQFLVNIFPQNIYTALVRDAKFQIVVVSIFLGVAVGFLEGKQRDYITEFFTSILLAFQEVIRWLLYILPLGILCLLSTQIVSSGTSILLVMIKFFLAFLLTALFAMVLNTIIIWKRSKKKLGYVLKSLLDPVIMALLSRNSFATLPIVVETVNKKLNFFEKTSSLIIPFGITIGRFGNILYFAMAAVFAQHLYGLEFTASRISIILISSIFAGIASVGTSGPAAVGILSYVLLPLGIPSEVIITLFIAVDILADPIRTLLIVHTNIASSTLIIEPIPTDGDRRLDKKRINPIITLRASVVVLIFATIALSGITTFILAYRGSKKSVYYVAENMMEEMSSAIIDKTSNYMGGAEALIRELKFMLENENFNLNNETTFLQLLREMLIINEEIGSIYLGRRDGSFAMVKRMLDGSISYRIIKRAKGYVTIDWIHDNEENSTLFPDETLPIDQGYDPRKRGWYNLALEEEKLIWQDVYLFSSDGIPGITCAIPVYIEDELAGVLGVDIGVAEFSFFLGALDLAETGESVLLNNKDEMIAVSADKASSKEKFTRFIKNNQENDKLELIPISQSQDPLISGSYREYLATKNIQQLPVFYVDGEPFVTYYKKFSPNSYFRWSIGIIIPEISFMVQVNRNNVIVLTLGSLFIVLSLLISLQFSKSISKPLKRLSAEMEKVRKFSLNEIEEVPSLIREVNDMNNSFTNMVTGLRSFNKYVPSNLVLKLMTLGKEAVIGGEKKILTIFFSDIKSFTTICEKYNHDHLVKELEKYLNVMSKTIITNSGTVDKYMGDGIMAFWGAPDEVKDHAVRACCTALDCQAHLKRLSQASPNSLFAKFITRIGINTGEVIVGNMGSDERLDYTVIGDPANLASRLESLNKLYGTHIIISESTYNLAKDWVEVRLLDKVAVKGKSEGVRIYELISRKGELGKTGEQFLKGVDYGATLYFNKEWKKAAAVYNRLLQLKSGDIPSQTMLDRCKEYLKNPPPEAWDGVYEIHTK